MKKSIRHRIMFLFISLMAGGLLVIWAINSWWLEGYYTSQKVNVMEEAYETIDAAVMERVDAGENIGDVITREMAREWEIFSQLARPPFAGEETGEETGGGSRGRVQSGEDILGEEIRQELDETLLGTIRRYGESNNITIVLIDSSTGKAVLNSGREGEFLARKAQRYVLGMGHEQTEILVQCDNYVVEKNQDHRQGGNYLESWGFFSDNNTLFLMQMPLASIRESVALSNRFITYVGIAAMVLGSIVMYLATWQVANPVMKLAALSERMSNLDFDARYEGDAQDEIGILGRSMNKLSEKLKETIGELKDANQQLQHDIEEKIQIDEMRKEFIANVSHELKTPIALIQGYAEGLTEGMAEDAQSRDYYCEVIMDEADKMNKMVKQLLTLTALEFGNDTPSMITFDITEMIRDFLNSASILFHQKDAHVDFEADGPLYVCADEFKTEEVLRNYLSNAMNHLDGARRIRVRAARTGESVTVWVYNTGNPIPQEDLPNLWTKFFKVDKARTRAYGGSGIGLSIVKAVQDAHHQICGVANVEDGVEFFFTLQAAREPES